MNHDYFELTDRLERAYSRRLALRQVSLADGWPLFEATRNPLFNKHLLWEPPENEFEVLRRIEAIVQAARAGRLAAVSGVVRSTGEWASLFRFQPYARDAHAMEMGVWTHDRFWAGRYTLELSHMVVDATFGVASVDRLMGAAAPDNRGSCSLMRSVGMAQAELVLRRTEAGDLVQLQEYELLREDWELRAAERAAHPSHDLVPGAGVEAGSTQAELKARRRQAADERSMATPDALRSDRDEELDAVE